MASMVINPPKDNTAAPLNAAPLVQPLAICEPRPNNKPPKSAKINRFFVVIFGLCSVLNFNLPDNAPERKAPASIPITSNTNQCIHGMIIIS